MKDGMMVTISYESKSRFTRKTLKIEDVVGNKADLSYKGEVVLRGIGLEYLKEV